MNGSGNIQYLTNQQIDKARWDHCIDNAGNGLIYAYSFYLDTMAENWDALVMNDYEVVMPLTWKKKYGIRYLYQPFLTAQLGVFGKIVTEQQCGDFIQAIPSKFRYIDISLNSGHISGIPTGYSIHRLNHILDLGKPYEDLYKNTGRTLRGTLRKLNRQAAKEKRDLM